MGFTIDFEKIAERVVNSISPEKIAEAVSNRIQSGVQKGLDDASKKKYSIDINNIDVKATGIKNIKNFEKRLNQ